MWEADYVDNVALDTYKYKLKIMDESPYYFVDIIRYEGDYYDSLI